MFFARGKKAVEGECVFSDMRVNQERDFGVELAEGGISGKRNGYDVADTAYINEDLVGPFVGEASAKLSDHRLPVLPLFVRPSTRLGVGCGYGKNGSTPFFGDPTWANTNFSDYAGGFNGSTQHQLEVYLG